MSGLKDHVTGAVKDTATGMVDEQVAVVDDFDPSEILSSLSPGGNGIPSADDLWLLSGDAFVMALVMALMPSPKQTGRILAWGTGVAKKDNVKDVSQEAAKHGYLDQVSTAKRANKRPGSTAKNCRDKDCSEFHFRTNGYCVKHCPDLNRDELGTIVKLPVHKEKKDPASPAAPAPAVEVAVDVEDVVADGAEGEKVAVDVVADVEGEEAVATTLSLDVNTEVEENGPASASPISPTSPKSPYSPTQLSIKKKLSRLENDFNSVSLREQMIDKAEIYDVEHTASLIPEAKAMLVGVKGLPDDIQLGQMLSQFRRLDVNSDGWFTAADMLALIKRFDAKFDQPVEQLSGWITKATLTESKFDFKGYVVMIIARRKLERNNFGLPKDKKIPHQFLQTPFWDLRSCVLHSLDKPLKGWVLKRGWLHAKESLNKWKLRYMQLGKDEAGRPTLEYWKNDPSGETNCLDEDTKEVKQPKRSIPLQNILVVDFALETVSPRGSVLPLREMQDRVGMDVENETVFKMTDAKGRRFTLACGKSEAVAWTSVLSRYSAASRLMFDWRENWGTGRKAKITMRDWVNATVVIAKIGRQKAAPEMCKEMMEAARTKTLWLGLPGGRERAIKKALYECNALVEGLVLTERDQKMLRVCNLSKEKMEKLGGYALSVVRAWNSSKDGLLKIDDYCMNGSVQYGVAATILAFDTYQFAAATNNSYHEKKYNVKTWVPKMNERDCAVCAMIFKTMSMRKTMGKHHCRTCGRVVCQMCSASRIYMPVSKKFERVCTSCLAKVPDNLEKEAAEEADGESDDEDAKLKEMAEDADSEDDEEATETD